MPLPPTTLPQPQATVLKVEVTAFDPAIPTTKVVTPNKALAEIARKVKIPDTIDAANDPQKMVGSEEAAAPAPAAAPAAAAPPQEAAAPVPQDPAAAEASSTLPQDMTAQTTRTLRAPADNHPAAASTNLTLSPAAADNPPAAADTAMINNAPADNHPAAAASNTKTTSSFLKLLALELPTINLKFNFKPIDLKFQPMDSTLPSLLGRFTRSKDVTATMTSPADPASRLELFQTNLITKYGPLKINNNLDEDMTTPGAPRNAAAAAAAVVALTTTMEIEAAPVTLVPQVEPAGAMTVAATPIGTQPAAAPQPLVRGAVGRKVHWAGKRLREVREGAAACCKKIRKGAAKRLTKLQQALSRSSSSK